MKDESGSSEMGQNLGLHFVNDSKSYGSIKCTQLGREF